MSNHPINIACPYSRTFRSIPLLDELILTFSPDSTFPSLTTFITSHLTPTQRANVFFPIPPTPDQISSLSALKHAHHSLIISLPLSTPDSTLTLLLQAHLPFYFSSPLTTWDAVNASVHRHPSELLIAEEICFDLENLSTYLSKLDKPPKLRCYPNVAQSSGENTSPYLPDITKFFIRPEDQSTYAPFISTLEIWGSPEYFNPTFDIYYRGSWNHDLSDLIADFSTPVPNYAIPPTFAPLRLNCHKVCNQNLCSYCPSTLKFANSMHSKYLSANETQSLTL